MFKSKMIVSIFAVVWLIYGFQNISYGQEAVTGEITECSGTRRAWPLETWVDVTIRGTVQATRNVTSLQITGSANGKSVGIDSMGQLSAGQSRNFSITGFIVTDENTLDCSVSLEWIEFTQPEPDPPENNEPPDGNTGSPPNNGQSGGTTYTSGEVIPTLPSGGSSVVFQGGFRSRNARFRLSGGVYTINFENGGFIETGGITYTCITSGGCTVRNGRVTQGTIQVGGTAPPPPVEESDLAVDQPTVSKSTLDPGERFTLSTTVRNNGSGRAGSTTLRYYRSSDNRISTGDTEVGTDSVSALSANRSSDESITVTAPTSPGTYYYGACVESVSDESNSNNNCSAAVRITVKQLKSDLVVDRPTVSKSTLAPGENFTLSATVKNNGEARAGSTTLRYYRSTDTTISTGDTEVGTDSVSALDANGSSAQSITLTAPTSPGTYYYGACVESVSDESNSNNNCSDAVSVTVNQPTLSASTPPRLTEAVLDSSEVTLTMTDATYDQSLSTISNAITVSGIVGVTVGTVRRVNDTEVTVTLAFDGTDFDTDATLTFSVGADAIANYDGSALTAQVPVTAIKGFDFDLSVPAGISMIHVPLKVTKVDGVAKTIESISDLYAALGGDDAVIFLMTYDSQQGWLGYWGTSDTGTAADRTLTDDMGIYARLIVPVSVQLTGETLGTIGSGTITLNQGLNLVGLPLRDSRITRVSDLFTLDGIRGNVFGISLADDGEFKTVGQAGDPGDIPVTGGQSFILTAQRSATVTISGEAWTNVSETAAAPSLSLKGIEVEDTTPVLALRGTIVDEQRDLNQSGFRVTVKNLSTGRSITGMTKAEGDVYKLTVVDIEMGQAAAIGDVLEISAQSPNPLIGVEPLRYTLTAEDVKRSLIQLPELVAYEIPAETQLLPNYPNPFNPETWIPYRLAEDAFVTLTIYDQTGQVVRSLDVGYQTAAVYESRSKAIYWDGRNEFGETVASGIYFYHLSADDYSATRKMLILK